MTNGNRCPLRLLDPVLAKRKREIKEDEETEKSETDMEYDRHNERTDGTVTVSNTTAQSNYGEENDCDEKCDCDEEDDTSDEEYDSDEENGSDAAIDASKTDDSRKGADSHTRDVSKRGGCEKDDSPVQRNSLEATGAVPRIDPADANNRQASARGVSRKTILTLHDRLLADARRMLDQPDHRLWEASEVVYTAAEALRGLQAHVNLEDSLTVYDSLLTRARNMIELHPYASNALYTAGKGVRDVLSASPEFQCPRDT
ncbi:hypothetical protein CC85DRAFT_305260 [Cutaneotrichosporon oleaginosum]|uniref:Uncharacterized protein n=1 Tax=Cutaneotrichosporon oleaginosum TaxID=879819 RepID=A0A0J0XDK6_9TREE|nr:uncharacterized protein CC85DRAFT_305260 [Cutaneotrichosporon oleaginosum]KLT39180.1 hypothetical protein CC85DRAFT_305260 [Cutaneotrichosporon oleaginosum]TXT04429.1 hypothetical protein COLE_07248 [Cutaneotrichosporon oleaginosum]